MPFVNYNGSIVDASQPVLMHNNRAFRYGDALFETIRLMNGEILYFEKHLDRLRRSMGYLEMEWPDSFNFQNLYLLIRHLDQVNNLNGNGRIRFEVFREDGGYYAPISNHISFLIEAEQLSEKEYRINETGLKVDFFTEVKKPMSRLSNLKSSNSLYYVMAGLSKQKSGLDDCIIFNSESNVAEAISSNIFLVSKGEVITPSLEQACISGVMREVVIELMKERGKRIVETKITEQVLLKAEEVFLTNTIDGVRWIGAIRTKRYFNSFSRWLVNELKTVHKPA